MLPLRALLLASCGSHICTSCWRAGGAGVTRGLCRKARAELEVGRRHPMSAGAGGDASGEWRWEVGWVCFESGKREKWRWSLRKSRKAGWGGASRADTRGAGGRGKRRSTEFVSLKCLWEGAGSDGRGGCEIWNKSDFCGSAGGERAPSLRGVSFLWHLLPVLDATTPAVRIPQKSHYFVSLRGVRDSWRRGWSSRQSEDERGLWWQHQSDNWFWHSHHCFLFPETCMRAVSPCYLWGVLCFLAHASALVSFINLFLEWYCLEQLRIMEGRWQLVSCIICWTCWAAA